MDNKAALEMYSEELGTSEHRWKRVEELLRNDTEKQDSDR